MFYMRNDQHAPLYVQTELFTKCVFCRFLYEFKSFSNHAAINPFLVDVRILYPWKTLKSL